jgi:hypothetical protein
MDPAPFQQSPWMARAMNRWNRCAAVRAQAAMERTGDEHRSIGGRFAGVLAPAVAKPKWRHKREETLGEQPDRQREPHQSDHAGGGSALVCVRCEHVITTSESAIEIGGLHEYTQVNPGGYVWNFRCFAAAPGCVCRGAPSAEFSWFPGYAWQVEHCARCDLHLGWRFGGQEPTFHGLITERLVEASRDESYS